MCVLQPICLTAYWPVLDYGWVWHTPREDAYFAQGSGVSDESRLFPETAVCII